MAKPARTRTRTQPHPGGPPLEPMLASLEPAPLRSDDLVYEPKYDGIRALVEVDVGGGPAGVRIWSRRGNEKTRQFPELVEVLGRLSRKLKSPVLLDGEIVALDEAGEPAGFQRLQSRIHASGREQERLARSRPVAFIAFDVLRDGSEDLRRLPLTARRARLERVLRAHRSAVLRLSDFVPGDGRALYAEALERGWEGLIAKDLDSPYQAGIRSRHWRKLKILQRQACVVGGETAAALLVGVYEGEGRREPGHKRSRAGPAGALEWVGHARIENAERARIAGRLEALETPDCPFRVQPRTSSPPRWLRPELVVEVSFTEWTRAGMLRHAQYVGLRDDVPPESVRREPVTSAPELAEADATLAEELRPQRTARPWAARHPEAAGKPAASGPRLGRLEAGLVARLEMIEANGGEGLLELPEGALEVSSLDRVLWPGPGITKGELMRYYVEVSPVLLPAVADRPLVMRLHPRGVAGASRYQQRAPAGVPPGVRVESLAIDRVVPSRIIGGSLLTLLYMVQIGAISQDPFFSRVGSLDSADHAVLDLDPMPGVGFHRVLDVARWVEDELLALDVASVPKTSGASGLHVYVPLVPGTAYESARLFCQMVATTVAERHPEVATVVREVNARGRRVYVDYLQNSRGKTLATAYSARASDFAGVSTPLAWKEVREGVDRREFTVRTLPARLRSMGDLWADVRESKGADLGDVVRRAGSGRRR